MRTELPDLQIPTRSDRCSVIVLRSSANAVTPCCWRLLPRIQMITETMREGMRGGNWFLLVNLVNLNGIKYSF